MPSSVAESVKKQVVLAGRLSPHAGRWVAVRGATVVAHDPTLAGLRKKVAGKSIDRAFRVPRRRIKLLL